MLVYDQDLVTSTNGCVLPALLISILTSPSSKHFWDVLIHLRVGFQCFRCGELGLPSSTCTCTVVIHVMNSYAMHQPMYLSLIVSNMLYVCIDLYPFILLFSRTVCYMTLLKHSYEFGTKQFIRVNALSWLLCAWLFHVAQAKFLSLPVFTSKLSTLRNFCIPFNFHFAVTSPCSYFLSLRCKLLVLISSSASNVLPWHLSFTCPKCNRVGRQLSTV